MKIRSPFLLFFSVVILGFINVNAQSQQNNDNQKIKQLIAKKRDYNKHYGTGYRIQLYNGTENYARRTRSRFLAEFSKSVAYLKYQTPEWKVQVGNYRTKLEADRALLYIKTKFSGAIVIPQGK